MTNTDANTAKKFAEKTWKLIMARSIFLILVGLILLIFPKGTLTTLVFIMGVYWLIDGIVTSVNSVLRRNIYKNWWWGLVTGGLGIIAGIVVLSKPFSSTVLTTSFLMWFLGIVAVLNGISGIVTGVRLQKTNRNERSMIWGGVFSVILGIVLMSSPFASALVIIKIIGSFALFAGLILMAVAFRIKKKSEDDLRD
ncbi:HdeD family acid-resistance protein [uncultured Draconibacterium sp.]|uniref:HdeD family acid-resistance protein n=2 Tax=uncultured Draconibacterium sp. TaxID=1573823 RepID=UPI003747D389